MKRFNLFIKIYLGFWLTIVIIVAAFVYLEHLIATEPVIKHWQNTVDKTVSFYAEETVAIYERDGADLLRRYFQRLEKATGIRAFLFTEQGVEITGRTIEKDIREQVSPAFQRAEPTYRRTEKSGIATNKIKSPKGHAYLFAAVIPHPRPPGFALGPPPPGVKLEPPPGRPPMLPFAHPRPDGWKFGFFIRLTVGLLVSGMICYLLARYLTAPIFKLGSAARLLADGNLSVRVKPALKGRRDELSVLAGDFDVMAHRLETLVNSQRDLLRDVSHELRSPLARLNVALELCRQHSGAQAQKHLDRMALETERLNTLITQILTYNKMSTRSVAIKMINFDLSELIVETVADANYEINGPRTVIRVNQPVILTGNADLLRRAIENVIRNALYHTPQQSIVEVSAEFILQEGRHQARITVRDHGKGVPEKALSLIFKPFFKLAEDSEHHAGVGLGLAISEAAIRLHLGTIRATNADDGGLIIEISLPAENR